MMPEDVRLDEARAQTAHWKRWGPYVSERQWGTVREDYSRDGTPGTTCRTTTRARAPTAGARTASRASATTTSGSASPSRSGTARSDPEGAAVRAHRARRQSRRGRQGVLLLSRQRRRRHSYMKISTSIRSRPFPYAAGRGEPPARPEPTGIRAGRHGHLRRRSLLRRLRRVREGRSHDILIRITRRQPRSGGGAAPSAADALVPQHVVVGPRRAAPRIERRRRARALVDRGRPRDARHALARLRGAPDAASSPKTRRTRRASRARERSAFVKDGSTTTSSTASRDAVNPARSGTKAAPHFASTIGPGETAVSGCGSPMLPPLANRSAPTSTRLFAAPPARGRRVLRDA